MAQKTEFSYYDSRYQLPKPSGRIFKQELIDDADKQGHVVDAFIFQQSLADFQNLKSDNFID